MTPPSDESFFQALNDPRTGKVKKQLGLAFFGMEMMELEKKLGNALSEGDSIGGYSFETEINAKRAWWKFW
jgi:hypothetical protein